MWLMKCDVSQVQMSHDIRVCVTNMWLVTCDMWFVTCNTWHVTCEMWLVTCDVWHVIRDKWCVPCDVWHVWHVTGLCRFRVLVLVFFQIKISDFQPGCGNTFWWMIDTAQSVHYWSKQSCMTLRNTPGHYATHLDVAQYCQNLFWRGQSWPCTLRNTPRHCAIPHILRNTVKIAVIHHNYSVII